MSEQRRLLDVGDETKKLAKTRAPKSDGSVQRCIDAFYDAYLRRWNPGVDPATTPKDQLVTPIIKGGKHGRHFKELLTSWGERPILDVIAVYFTTTDPEITRHDYSLDFFFLKAEYLRLKAVRRTVDERTRGNIDAASRATGRKS